MQRLLTQIQNQIRKLWKTNRFALIVMLMISGLLLIAILGIIITGGPNSPLLPGNQGSSSSSTISALLPRAGTDTGNHAETDLLAELLRILPYQGLDYRIELIEGRIVLKYDRSKAYAKQAGLTFLQQYDIFNQTIPLVQEPY